eukprot:CAMPEP_0172722084 /NCGR_PEP_ID=MMETSP1074-20121228/80620_1 /TAXON_ID=2916 /ORGANISM="Ceratium fusus, Strain PA161109" /LENGTH=600 /DNA_ID=CAMNT_0013547999 /DNA_START=52 /DNA_END=1854 /DNA_ORIENTATION=+
MDHSDNAPEGIRHSTPRSSRWAAKRGSHSCHGFEGVRNGGDHASEKSGGATPPLICSAAEPRSCHGHDLCNGGPHVNDGFDSDGFPLHGPATETERQRNRNLLHRLMDQTGELNQQCDVESNQFQLVEIETRKEAERIQDENIALRGHIAKAIENICYIRGENRNAHKMAQKKCNGVKTNLAAICTSLDTGVDVAGLRAEFSSVANEIQTFRKSVQHERMRVRTDMDAFSKAKAVLSSEVAQLVSQVWTVKTQIQNLRIKDSAQERRIQQQQQQQHEMRAMGVSVTAPGEIASMKAHNDMLVGDFRRLLTRLHDVGALAPKREVFVKEERPPVGTIELGEDCFSARLLIRLGFLKASGWKEHSSDDDQCLEEHGLRASTVVGLQEPEIKEDGPGYNQVTSGWLFVCVLTLTIQVLVTLAMLANGGLATADNCLKEPLSHSAWLLLHISKAFALCVGGMHLAKDLMNTVNYWMVSELLEATRSKEVAISAVLRGLLTVLIAAANIVMYRYMTSPANVWINMTALAFINDLGCYVVAVTKSGVFGHHLSKTLTTLNFQLTLVSTYPAWFAWARNTALTLCVGAISLLGLLMFSVPDNMCNAS